MPAVFKSSLGTQVATASATTLVITTTAAIAVGDLVVVRVAADNLSGTTPTFTCTDSGGNAYTTHIQRQVGAAAAGVIGGLAAAKATTAVNTGGTITITLSGAVAAKAAYVESFTGVENTVRSAAIAIVASNGALAPGATGTVNSGDLVLAWTAYENRTANTGDSDTLNGNWSTFYVLPNATSGTATNCVEVGGQYKIATAAGAQTWTGGGPTADCCGGVVVLQETPVPSIAQSRYQFFQEGTEAGATSMAAADTAITADITNQEGAGSLRIRLQSTTAVPIDALDSFQLQWEKNASGTWTTVTTAGTTVDAYDAAALTDGAVTTNRLGAGLNSFVAGKVSETGTVSNMGWTANNYTELLYAIIVRQTGLVNGDTLRFRVVRNGSLQLTYTSTPTINVIKTDPAITQAAYRFYGDGTESASTALAAQDTAAPADVSTADANLQLRVRLQSTNTAPLAATDDFQLEVETSASAGNWFPVVIGGGELLADTYQTIFYDHEMFFGISSARAGQSFLGDGRVLSRCGFYMRRIGTPASSTLVAKLYAHTGTLGSTGTPTGTALATSTTTITSSTISTSLAWVYFAFDETLIMTYGTTYFIVVEGPTTGGDTSNCFVMADDTSSPGHIGNAANYFGTWSPSATSDMIFEVYSKPSAPAYLVHAYISPNVTDGAATTNRLTGGTGSFTAGKVSEGGVVADLGWPGNNFTELLYSLTVRQLDVANGQTLRFRVLKNGVTTGVTYSQYPSLSIIEVAGPSPQTWDGSTGTIGAAGQSGSFVGGAVTWGPAPPTPGPQVPKQRWVLKNTAYLAAESITLTGAVAGRVLVATLAARSSAGATITPAGWTVIGAQLGDHGTSSPTLAMWAKVSTGPETVAFWDATYDANKLLVVEEYDFTLTGLTPVGGNFLDSGATATSDCVIVTPDNPTVNVLYLAGVAVRDVITGMTQGGSSWNIPGYWDQNLITLDGNYVELHTNAYYTNTSAEGFLYAQWTGAQRNRGRVVGLEVVLAPVVGAGIGVAGQSGAFTAGTVTWVGSTATVGVAGQSGTFTVPGVADGRNLESGGGRNTEDAEPRYLESAVVVVAPQTWVGSTGSVGVAGQSGSFAGVTTWVGSTATIGVAGQSGAFVGGAQIWGGGPATPTLPAITGLASRYDPSDTASITSSGGLVSQLSDLSGAGRHMVQATGTMKPLTGTRTINGRNVLDFDGSNDILLTAANWTAPGPKTMFVVVQSDQIPLQAHVTSYPSPCIFNWDGVWGLYSDTGIQTAIAVDLNPHVLSATFDPAGSAIWVDGVLGGTGAISGAWDGQIGIGDDPGGAGAWDGTIAEYLIYDRVLSAAERGQVESYLNAKWMLPAAPADDIATIGVAGVSGAFAAGAAPPQTWVGSTATIGVAGQSGSFVPAAVTWVGSTATIGVAGQAGSLVGGGVTWIGTTAATVGVAGQSGVFVPSAVTWVGTTAATVGVAGQSGSFVGGATTWTGGAAALIGVAGTSGSFVAGAAPPQTWVGSDATLGVAGQSGVFVGGATTWVGSTGAVGVAGQSGSFAPGTVTWVGSTATIGVAGQSGSFVAGTAPWAGSTATIGVLGVSGGFAGLGAWPGSTASVGVAGQSGAFAAGAITWTGGSTAAIGVAGVSGTYTQTWVGSVGSVGVAGQSSAFAGGAITWDGSTATIGTAGQSGVLVGGAVTWVGSTASVGAAGQSGSFIPGPATWVSGTAAVGVAGISGAFYTPPPQTWVGSTATIGVNAISGGFGGGGVWPGSVATVGVAGQSGTFVAAAITWVGGSIATVGAAGQSGSFVAGAAVWAGSIGTIGVAGQSGAFSTGAAVWAGSIASVGVYGQSGLFVIGTVVWAGSTATVGVAAVSGVFVGGATTWVGSIARVGVRGMPGEWAAGIITIVGWFNGQPTTALQWGDQPVLEFLLTPPVPVEQGV